MSALFSKTKLPPREGEPTGPPSLTDPSVTAAMRDTNLDAAQTFGRASTVLTGGTGVAAPPTVQRKTLLGG